jgi:hypothetical protein
MPFLSSLMIEAIDTLVDSDITMYITKLLKKNAHGPTRTGDTWIRKIQYQQGKRGFFP